MTVLSVAKDAALALPLTQPTSIFSSSNREDKELARIANRVAKQIMRDYAWQALMVQKTYTGDGTSEAFALPSDYDRMLEGADMWSSRWQWPFNHISDLNLWLELQVTPYTFVDGNWTVYGDEFHFLPVMASDETLKFWYVSKNYAKDSNGVAKASFTADTDTFRLGEDVLELGIIYHWKKDKGLPFEEHMREYETLLAQRAKADRGANSVVSGERMRLPRRAVYAFPQTVG